MRISVSFVLRLGGADSLAPLEKAMVYKDGERAMHRDGGYYVFITPMKSGERITVSASGFLPTELHWDGGFSAAVYLSREGVQPRELTLLSAGKYDKGAQEITAVCPGGTLPAMLEGCTLKYGKHVAAIVGWNRAAGIIKLPPLEEKITQGQSLTVIAPTPASDNK